MTLKVSPNYAASPSEVFMAEDNIGAVIAGGNQYVGLAIVGAYRVSAFSVRVEQDETEGNLSIILHMAMWQGYDVRFGVVGVRRTLAACRSVGTDVEIRMSMS